MVECSLQNEVSLRPMTHEMCHELYKGFQNDPAIGHYYEYVYSTENVDRYFANNTVSDRKLFAVMVGDQIVGECKLKNIDLDKQECSMGIHLRDDTVKEKGYGTQAERLILKYAFEELGLFAVNADAALKNTRSQHVLEKVGFCYIREDETFKYYRCTKVSNHYIRKARPGDEKILANIQTQSWKAAFADILTPEELERCTDLQKAEQMYKDVLRREGCSMAIEFVEEKPHCIAAWGKNRCDLGDSVGELICIHSLQNGWGKGHGSAMMEYVLDQLHEAHCEAVILWVFEANTRARKFYEKHGFVLAEHKKLANGIPELMYIKSLQ